MHPTLASDGSSALTKLDQAAASGSPINLVLLDAKLQDMDGFEVVERIRQNPRLRDCQIIILSSAGLMEDSERCKDLDVARYLIKPVKQSDLRDAILRQLVGSEHPVAKSQAVAANAADGSIATAETQSLLILLAEDSLVNQKVACGLLERRGHKVHIANNGREAVEAIGNQSYDLVLMDVMMPEMDGFEATTAIRELEKRLGKRTPIVAMTAHALKDDRERCLKAGMDAYLPKPVQPKALYEMIASISRGG